MLRTVYKTILHIQLVHCAVADHGTGMNDERNTMHRLSVTNAINDLLMNDTEGENTHGGLPLHTPMYDRHGAVAIVQAEMQKGE